jgi:hypothetical protein
MRPGDLFAVDAPSEGRVEIPAEIDMPTWLNGKLAKAESGHAPLGERDLALCVEIDRMRHLSTTTTRTRLRQRARRQCSWRSKVS